MSAIKKTFSNSLVVVIFLTVLVSAFFIYNYLNRKTYEAIDAIPQEASFFVEFNSIRDIATELKSNKMWNELRKIEAISAFEKDYDLFDSIGFNHTQLAHFSSEGNGIIAVHTQEDINNYLLVLEIGHQFVIANADKYFDDVFGTNFTRLQSKYNGEKIKKIILNNAETSFSYALIGNLFIGSINEALVKASIDHLNNKQSIMLNADFKALKKSAGKKVDANIYLNHAHFKKFFGNLTHSDYQNFCHKTDNLFSWTGLDLILKEDELLLNGYSTANDSSQHLLAAFYTQKPQHISLTGILPFNTSLMIHYGVEDYTKYFNDYKDHLKAFERYDAFRKKIDRLNIALKSNLEHLLLPLVGNEIALASYATNPSAFKDQTYAIIKTKDMQACRRQWAKIHSNVRGSGLVKNYKGHAIYRINAKGITPILLGPTFEVIQNFNYFFLNGFMIIGNNASALQSFIDLYQSGKTLDLNDNYQAFTDNIYQESNFYVYCNIRNGFDLLKKYLAPDFFKQLGAPLSFRNFHAAGLQISNVQGKLFTNLYLKYNAEIVEENRSIWKANLDASIKGQPYTVRNHRNNTNNIVVFDVQNNMYLFDADGNRLWKKTINESIQSRVHVVDYYKNGKYQYLFNTQNYLHLIDLLGRYVEGYPRKLTNPATNGLAVFDYENSKNYRILIASSDKKIYNYNIKGNEVKGWTKAQTLNIVNKELQHLVSNRRDYIFAGDNQGVLKILNRLGKDRILAKRQFKQSRFADIYVNRTNQKGAFITTNTKGMLTYISTSGDIKETDFGNFSDRHFFLYEDFNKNGHKDFIYLDNNKLRVYDRFKKPVFSYEFNSEINQKPVFYNISGNQSLLGVVSHDSQEIFLFDKNGKVVISKGLIGDTPFVIESLHNNRQLNLIVGSGSSIYNYVIK